MWPNPQLPPLLKKALMENFIFCAVQGSFFGKLAALVRCYIYVFFATLWLFSFPFSLERTVF